MDLTRSGNTLVLAGDFDVRHTSDVRGAIYELLQQGGDVVVLEVSQVTSVDLTALRVVAMATKLAGRSGQRLVLRGCSPTVVRMLHLTRLVRVVHVERYEISA